MSLLLLHYFPAPLDPRADILFLFYLPRVSLTLLFTISFKIDHKLGRLIVSLVLTVVSLVLCFVFSLLRTHASLQTLSNRISYSFCCSVTGAWLIFGIGLDIFVRSGLLDGMTLLVSSRGVFESGPLEDEGDENDRENVVRWNEGKCKGLIAAMWLM